jgi:hypothetical protein
MFARVVALSVLTVWLALMGLGYASSDNLDTYIVPSIVALDNQDYADDVDSYRLLDFALLPVLFFLNLPELTFHPIDSPIAQISPDLSKRFELNCSLLL